MDRLEAAYFGIDHAGAEMFPVLCECRKEDSPIHEYEERITSVYRELISLQRTIAFAHPNELCWA